MKPASKVTNSKSKETLQPVIEEDESNAAQSSKSKSKSFGEDSSKKGHNNFQI